MFKKAKTLFLILTFLGSVPIYAQRIGISNNAVFDLAGALSAGVEVPISRSTSVELYGSFRPWKRAERKVHKHWLLQTQFRIWPCQLMNGFFFGPYAHVGEYNIGNHDFCLGLLNGLKPDRYEGWLAGAGLGCGYEYPLARHWNVGAEIGVGWTYVHYKKYDCEICGDLKGKGNYNYVGVNRVGLSLIYIF